MPEDSFSTSFGWETNAFTNNHHVVTSIKLLIFSTLLMTSLILQHFVANIWKIKYLPEAGVTMILGMFLGGIIRLCHDVGKSSYDSSFLQFSPSIFFFGFLPPIIYNSGYHLKRKLFKINIGAILSLAFIGTFVSTIITAIGIYYLSHSEYINKNSNTLSIMESVAFGSLLSSTDPVTTLAVYSSLRVDPTLFYIVFGESVLNDAIAITIFRVSINLIGKDSIPLSDYFITFFNILVIFIGSSLIGYTLGIVAAWLFRKSNFKSSHKIIPVCVFLCTVYIPFFLSEMIQLSGIVAIFFTGISSRRYVSKNIVHEVKKLSSFLFQLTAYLAETSCFLLLGVSLFLDNLLHSFNFSFIVGVTLVCLLARAAHVYPILTIVNQIRRRRLVRVDNLKQTEFLDISTNIQHMIFFAGLRGAVAYALANMFPDTNGHRSLVINTTSFIIVFTVFILGGLTEFIIAFLNIQTNVDPVEYLRRMESSESNSPSGGLRNIDFERRYLYPCILESRKQKSHHSSGGGTSQGNRIVDESDSKIEYYKNSPSPVYEKKGNYSYEACSMSTVEPLNLSEIVKFRLSPLHETKIHVNSPDAMSSNASRSVIYSEDSIPCNLNLISTTVENENMTLTEENLKTFEESKTEKTQLWNYGRDV